MSSSQIRKPAAAGLFYPASVIELTQNIATLFAHTDKVPLDGKPIGLIVPHAGYPYSGSTAAKAYKLLEGEQYDTVVVVSPSHTVFFRGSSVYDGNGYETPLGVVEIDKELSQKIATIHPSIYFSSMGHATGATRGEHALEVQLPFLQVVLGKFKLVAIVMGDQEENTINALAETLAVALKNTNSLLVASSDLSHFHSEKVARSLDGTIQNAVEKYNPELLQNILDSGKGEACGGGIMIAAMKATKKLGGKKVQFLQYATSGETTGDFEEVVGYLSAVIITDKKGNEYQTILGTKEARQKTDFSLTEQDKQELLKIAREAIKAHLEGKSYTPPTIDSLKEERGVFVTLKIRGFLRGCIGYIKAREPLYKAVAEMAVAAAFDDPRFPKLSPEEYEQLEYEISVLSPLKRVYDIDKIKIGRDGLMIKLDFHSGLLLPQVATENGWDRLQFLEQTCLKAGLPKNSYKDPQAEIYRFSADIF